MRTGYCGAGACPSLVASGPVATTRISDTSDGRSMMGKVACRSSSRRINPSPGEGRCRATGPEIGANRVLMKVRAAGLVTAMSMAIPRDGQADEIAEATLAILPPTRPGPPLSPLQFLDSADGVLSRQSSMLPLNPFLHAVTGAVTSTCKPGAVRDDPRRPPPDTPKPTIVMFVRGTGWSAARVSGAMPSAGRVSLTMARSASMDGIGIPPGFSGARLLQA